MTVRKIVHIMGCPARRDGSNHPKTCGAHMDRIAQGITNRAHCSTETEDWRIQNSHSQPHVRFSTCFLRGADRHRLVIAGTCRHQPAAVVSPGWRSEEHTSELQSRLHLVCRLLLEKKKKNSYPILPENKNKRKRNITTF